MTFASCCSNLNLNEMIEHVLIEDIWQKSMGRTIDESTKAHHFVEYGSLMDVFTPVTFVHTRFRLFM